MQGCERMRRDTELTGQVNGGTLELCQPNIGCGTKHTGIRLLLKREPEAIKKIGDRLGRERDIGPFCGFQ